MKKREAVLSLVEKKSRAVHGGGRAARGRARRLTSEKKAQPTLIPNRRLSFHNTDLVPMSLEENV